MGKPAYVNKCKASPSRARSRAKPKGRGRARSAVSAKSGCTHRSASSYNASTLSSMSTVSDASSIISEGPKKSRSYARIKHGIKKSVPAAVVLWAFHKLPSSNGLTSRRVITFLKKNFKLNSSNPRKVGKTIGNMLRMAVDYGMLERRGTRYYLKSKKGRPYN